MGPREDQESLAFLAIIGGAGERESRVVDRIGIAALHHCAREQRAAITLEAGVEPILPHQELCDRFPAVPSRRGARGEEERGWSACGGRLKQGSDGASGLPRLTIR